MKILIEVIIPDEKIDHATVAQSMTQRILDRVEGHITLQGHYDDAVISGSWEYKNKRGSMRREKNPT